MPSLAKIEAANPELAALIRRWIDLTGDVVEAYAEWEMKEQLADLKLDSVPRFLRGIVRDLIDSAADGGIDRLGDRVESGVEEKLLDLFGVDAEEPAPVE